MTALPIASGPTNKEIINRAYQLLGLSDSMFGRTNEEYATAVAVLETMMLEPPFSSLGFDYEEGMGQRVEQESGIERKYQETVAYSLANRIAPTIGKTLSAEAVKEGVRLLSRLSAEYAAANLPTVGYAAGTPRGAGNKSSGGYTFFNAGD